MRYLVAGFLGSLLLVAGACGGKVVVESTGATGATGAGGAGGAATTDTGNGGFFASTGDVSPVGVVSAVSSSTGGATLCEQLCADQMSKGCDQGGSQCVMSCIEAYANVGMCKPQLDSLLQCILTSSDTLCDNLVMCQGQLQAYTTCTQPMMMCTGPTICTGTNNGNCDCKTDCNGSKLEVYCSAGDKATESCVCLKNGMPISKCLEPQDTGLSCNIVKGCCAASFFL